MHDKYSILNVSFAIFFFVTNRYRLRSIQIMDQLVSETNFFQSIDRTGGNNFDRYSTKFFSPLKFAINNSVSASNAPEERERSQGKRGSAEHVRDWRRVKPSVNQHYGICMLFTREPPSTFVWIIPEINQCPFPRATPSFDATASSSRDPQESRQMALVCPLYVRLHHSGNVTIASLQVTCPSTST